VTRLVQLEEHKVVGDDFTHAITTWVSVPASVAFDYVADVTRHPEWAESPMTAELLDPPPVQVGSRYRAVGHQGGRDWPSNLVVTELDRPRRFAFTADGGPIPASAEHLHRHEFTFADEGGGTRVVIRRTNPIPSRLVRLLLPLIAGYALRVRLRTIENLRRRLEALPRAG
jgi:ligand-binding SRPBCC domain-containing protein